MDPTEQKVSELLSRYQNGERSFVELDIENGDLRGTKLADATFENCFLTVDFRGANLRNSKFINGNIKTCDFREADLTHAHFEELAVDSTRFKGAKTKGLVFKNNYVMGQQVNQQDFEEYFSKE